MRLWHLLSYLLFIVREVLKGSWQIASDALTPGHAATPAIVELPLRCRSDLEVTAMASSITITPGTLVVGTASAADEDGTPTLFVHSLYGRSRPEILDGLRDMESRLLRVTRPAGSVDAGGSVRTREGGRP